jgi:hypothetical protein
MGERLFEELMGLSGRFVLTLEDGEKRIVSLMFNSPVYPGHAPFIQTTEIFPGVERIFTVQMHFVDYGPA